MSRTSMAVCPELTAFTSTVIAPPFTVATNSLVQLSTEPVMRGRVIAILLAVALGGAPIGAPIVGWIADRFGPRWALGVGAAAGLAGAMAAIRYLTKHGTLRVRIDFERPPLQPGLLARKFRRRCSPAPPTRLNEPINARWGQNWSAADQPQDWCRLQA